MSCQCRECKGKACRCKFCYQKKNCGYAKFDDCRWECIKKDENESATVKFKVFLRKSKNEQDQSILSRTDISEIAMNETSM
jgi:hypothetical protein